MKKITDIALVFLIGISTLFLSVACDDDYSVNTYKDKNEYYQEKYRPLMHFTPKRFWMNDPNGMVYLDGEYHLYYQHNPVNSFWGNLSWGHAVSKDLIHWEHLDVALTRDKLGDIFSGSAVIDKKNTAGFGENALVAVYTSDSSEGQVQSMAHSLDRGRTFSTYTGNPVLKKADNRDFRDPKVFWYEEGGYWVMSVALSVLQQIEFYKSTDLKYWEKLSDFRLAEGSMAGHILWECPDLFPISYQGKQKWVLILSINPGGPNGGSATQYFIGDFDGVNFIQDDLPYPLWLDYGTDNYAGVTWSNAPDNRLLLIGWMSNWEYASRVPTHTWRAAMTLPRELALQEHPDGYPVLTANVIPEFENIAGEWREVSANESFYELAPQGPYHLEVTLQIPATGKCGFSLINNEGDYLKFEVNRRDNRLVIDRTNSGEVSFSQQFMKEIHSPLHATSDIVTLDVYVDYSSIECLVDKGIVQQTNLVFPSDIYSGIKEEEMEEEATIKRIRVRSINSIW